MRTIRITGTGSALPGRIVTNKELEQMVETSDEWIRERTGIGERHVSVGETVVTLASEAARKALEQAGKRAEEIDLILVATCSPEQYLPCCACRVQADIGAVNALAFDVNAACSGFLFALNTADAYLRMGLAENALIIGSEVPSKLVDWTDRGTCILFGDGAAAAVVECREGWPSIGAVLGSRGDDVLLRLPGLGRGEPNVLSMEGTQVFKFAVETVPACMDATLKKAGLTPADIDFFVFHQANARIIDLAVRKYRIPPEKYYKNIDRYGNTAAASVPLVLSELVEQGRVGPGSRLLLTAFGGGLTWGGAVLEMA